MAVNITNRNNNKIRNFRKKWRLNVGNLLFGIIFLYLVITVFSYLTANRTTPYEVRMGSILNDTAHTGIAIREETLFKAEQDGYINYFSTEKAKVKIGTDIYATSDHELVKESSAGLADTQKQLTNDQQRSLGVIVQSFTDNFSEQMFTDVYSFKDAVKTSLSGISSTNKANYLDKLIAEGNELNITQAVDDGIVVYSADGYESLKKEDVNQNIFHKTDYSSNEFYNNMKVSKGDPVYRLVTSEEWMVVVPVSEETAEMIKRKHSIRVRFKKDNEVMTAGLTMKKKDDQNFAYLSLDSAMIRYAGERFLDLELILDDAAGLKIPKSALTQKPFYIVPMEYITYGGDSNNEGVMRKTKNKKGEEITEFVKTPVYYIENNMAYLDTKTLNADDVLLKPDSNMTCVVEEQRKLDGVFHINRGYAVFKHVKILCESDDYYIVQAGNDYGLANYDHIALNSKKVKENEIITQ